MPLLTQTIASLDRDIGFPVRRLLPTRQARRVGPSCFSITWARPISPPKAAPAMCGRIRTSAWPPSPICFPAR